MGEYKIPLERIEAFLRGFDDEKFIVNIEYEAETNTIFKIKENPELGTKVIEKDTLKAFLWMKDLSAISKNVRYRDSAGNWVQGFHGGTVGIKKAREKYGIEITALKHGDDPRLKNGYRWKVTCSQGHNSLMEFFKTGGIYPYDKRNGMSENFVILKPVEQYLISTGKRIFKGFEEYNQIHKFVFDIETTGLDPETSRIFLIGMKDNAEGNFEKLQATNLDDDSEREAIQMFFKFIDIRKPTIIGGYNSANFDWAFIWRRAEILGLDMKEIAYTLNKNYNITKNTQNLKLGGEVETFDQVSMFGYSIIDIIHSARRAQAIDSDMKSAALKYVCKYNKIAKKNRVYVEGGLIHKIWGSTDTYYFDEKTGSYPKTKPTIEYMDYITKDVMRSNSKKIFLFGDNDERTGFGGQAKEMRGEPNAIGIRTKAKASHNSDSYYSDVNYSENIKKITEDIALVMKEIRAGKTIVIPSAGIGTGLAELKTRAPKTLQAIEDLLLALKKYCESFREVDGRYIVERYLMDDLWETMEVDNIYNQTGFLLASMVPTTYQKITTMGTAGLWKMLMQAWSWENDLALPVADTKRDFVGGLSFMLKVGFSKNLRKLDFNSLYPAIELAHDVFPTCDIDGVMKSMLKYFHSERFKAKDLSDKYKKTDPQLSAFYKRKQLPLKIFINAMFGALGGPHAFPWAEINVAERITCIARQYLRLMLKFFINRGYTPLNGDTDGVNFMAPPGGDDHFEYIGKGLHHEVEKGKVYKGIKALTAEFNDLYMKGEMGLGLDGVWPSTINLARKNYAIMEDDGSFKKTGNSIKSKKMPSYIEEFIDKAIKLLLEGKGREFVDYYYDYCDKIVNKEIPLAKIATKSKVKKSLEAYKNRGNNIKGQPLPKQAHMELAIQNNLHVNLGDVLYYVNIAKTKSASDVGIGPDGQPFSVLIDPKQLEDQPDLKGEYNVSRYLEMFNKRVHGLLICFDKNVRDKILIKDPTVKVKKPKVKKLKKGETPLPEVTEPETNGRINITQPPFLLCELELINGQPFEDDEQDTLEFLYTPSEMELEHWAQVNYNPLIWNDPAAKFTVPGLGFEREMI